MSGLSPGTELVRAMTRFMKKATSTADVIDMVLRSLCDVIESDSVIFDELSLRNGTTRGATYPADRVEVWGDRMELFERWHYQSPNVQYFRANPDGTARRWSDGDIDAFRQTELYQDFMAPLGIHYQMSFVVPSPAGIQRAFIFNRCEHDFSDAEVALCDELAPYLGLLFSSAAQRALSLLQQFEGDEGLAVAVDHSGAVDTVIRQGEPGLTPEVNLDTVLVAWVQSSLAERDVRRNASARSSHLRLSTGERVDVRLLPDPGGLNVLIVRALRESVDLPALLTARQGDVLYELAAGGTNVEIAARLGIAVETLKKHLTAIYRVLGVADRASAIAALRSAQSIEKGDATL